MSFHFSSLIIYTTLDNAIKLVDFKLEIARTLSNIGSSLTPKRVRPSEVQKKIMKKNKPNAAPVPLQDVRQDQLNHFPHWNTTRIRCKFPNCRSQTYVVCDKCKRALCFSKERNCFKKLYS